MSQDQVLQFGPDGDELYTGKIQQIYFIHSVPRTGSYLLCSALEQTGIAGKPNEYFNRSLVWELVERWKALTLRLHVRRLRRKRLNFRHKELKAFATQLLRWRTGPNGVFGAKIHYDQFSEIGQPDLKTLFPKLKYIYTMRREASRQAVSFEKALQTSQWYANCTARAIPTYKFDDIFQRHCNLIKQYRGWEQYFVEQGIEPLRIVYEDFIADYEATIRRVLAYLDIPGHRSVAIPPPPIKKQADGINEEWLARYHHDLQKYGLTTTLSNLQPSRAAA